MTDTNNKPSLRNASRADRKSPLNLSRAVSAVERTGKPVTQSVEPRLRLRDALIDDE